jgi:hypothetical protein
VCRSGSRGKGVGIGIRIGIGIVKDGTCNYIIL